MNELTIVTPCIRPHYLDKIYDSIRVATRNFKSLPMWIVVMDTSVKIHTWDTQKQIFVINYKEPSSIKGSAQRNYALDRYVHTRWVMFHDDDTTFHPEIFNTVMPVLEETGKNVVVSQIRGSGVTLDALPANMRPCHVDIGQVILKTSTIGSSRFQHDGCQDGMLYQELYEKNPSDFVFLTDKYVSYFNKI